MGGHQVCTEGSVQIFLALVFVTSSVFRACLAESSRDDQLQFIEGRDFDHICDGWDEEWGNCEDLPACGPCEPSDCIWGQWGEWNYAGGCIGLKLRERPIEVRANQCGQPCEGPKEVSVPYTLDRCKPEGADCLLSPWTEWSTCRSEQDQSMRKREVDKPPETGGVPCIGSLEETRPCGGPKKTDCRFGPWQDWTSCSATCDEGRHTRMRRVEQEAHNDGQTCQDSLLETAPCSAEPCAGQDCRLSGWTSWSGCDTGRTQRFRSRQILQAPVGSGRPCEEKLTETLGCPLPDPVDCIVSHWSEWSACDKNCDGGQRYRERQVEAPAKNGGRCESVTLKDTEPCSTQACNRGAPQNCILSPWTTWSSCSATCGEGSRTRERKVSSYATWGGEGCDGGLSEIGRCSGEPCSRTDCAWGTWEQWSPCSLSCGGGTKHRTRQVVTSPTNGGRPCAAEDKGQVAPCSMQPCGEGCVDGVWGQWRQWTECSGTCHNSYKTRRRNVDVHPNHCGEPPTGLREEFQQCSDLPPCTTVRDCQVAEWGEWSQCSTHCFGIRERNRFIAEFAAGGGLPCNHGLKQIEPCNPGEHEQTPSNCADKPLEDCIMDKWASWSSCSVSCGGGQMARRRSMLSPSRNGGRPCASDLVVTAPCSTQPCPSTSGCQDCKWGEWSEWSACSRCGGQKYRHRSIERMPNQCGKRCDLKTAKEVTECPDKCGDLRFCAWTEWSPEHCSNRCGNSTSMRNRVLGLVRDAKDYLFVGTDGAECSGTQLNQSLCPYAGPCKECTPMDCEFAPWSAWTQPSCQGLCERNRVIARMNNECGRPCDGSLLETKRCPTTPCDQPKDCILSEWGQWTTCQATENSQKYRNRAIKQKPAHGGEPCQGVLSETTGCSVNVQAESCHFGPWEAWSSCSLSCGIGWHVRSREVVMPTHPGGLLCRGNLKELERCESWDEQVCHHAGKVDCLLDNWGEWSICGGDGQRYRDRKIMRPATHDGEPCEGCLHETETCALEKIDCRYSAWTEWDRCDRECGKGQTHRQRQIHRFPENGGKTCPHELMMTKGCQRTPCLVHNATVGDWTQWGACEAACGPGMQRRTRDIERLRDPGGRGFTGMLGESRECPDNPTCDVADCAWEDWGAWADCSTSCGGGQKRRERRIKTYPRKGGKSCEAEDLAEVEPCNTHPCGEERCQDGAWFDWSDWAPCSASCDGGTTFRTRKISRMANECGCPPHGKDRETAFCNVDAPCGNSVNCEFGMWTEWDDCSATCDGVKRRSRRVETYGTGNGDWCTGGLRQTWPCNPSPNEDPPEGCLDGPRVDCLLSDWTEWSLCSATCGGGEHIRSRSIRRHPANRGKPCEDSLSEIKECARSQCGGPAATDCRFGNWEEWGECDKCSGERTRFRSILSFPVNGGKECEPTATKEVGQCPRRCHHPKFCEWEDWSKWTDCTVTCGKGGKRRRRRHLHLSDFAESHVAVMQGYEVLRQQAQELESQNPTEILAAFGAGCTAVLMALAAVRIVAPRPRVPEGSRGVRSYSRLPEESHPAGYEELAEVGEATSRLRLA